MTSQDIQEIIRKLMAGEPIDGWELNPTQAPRYSSPEHGGPTLPGDSTPIGASYLDKDKGMWSAYDMSGDLQRTSAESTGASTFKNFLGDALKIGGAMSGLSGLGSALNGGSFLSGAQAPFNAVFGLGDAALGGADALASTLGGGGGEALGSLPGVAASGAALPATTGAMTLADLGLSAIPSMGAGPGILSGLGTAAAGAGMTSAARGALNSAEGYGPGMSGAETSIYDAGINGKSLLSGLGDIAGNLPWQNILGAGLGAALSQDQTQTKTNAPWEPAQPFIKQQLAQGQALSADRAANPFSPQQKVAYNNMGGLLNTINGNAQGLMSGFNANASGANNYDRNDPRRKLIGSSFDMSSFAPGLLNFFPKG